MAGTLFVVATPIGNLEDISARAVRVLREASVIAAEDTRHTGRLLQHFGIATPTTSFHEHSEPGKAGQLLDRLRAGETVALVTDAGTPIVSDPGEPLVPLVAALSASGFGSDGFAFFGFPPSKGSDRRAWFDRLASARAVVPVVVFYEAPHRIESTMAELLRRVGDVRVCVARELTKAHEDVRVGRISELRLDQIRGEFTVVVELGHKTEPVEPMAEPSPAVVANEFVHLTKREGLTRRQAMTSLARKHGLSARRIFDLLEKAKRSPV
jgi:16S rRNA (cytidine1402-2'-O)-methyltransferase